MQLYGRLFYLLHRSTDYISQLATSVKFSEIDQFLQTVMFSLYGSHNCEAEEEHLLLRVFRTLMASELANAQSINEFFRQNSVLTRMLTTYTRRGPGFRYIETVQGDIVREIVAATAGGEKLNLEINPNKIFDEYAAKYRAEHDGAQCWGDGEPPKPEEQAELPYVKELVAKRVPVIESYVERLLAAYESHIQDVPYEMRWICRQIKELIRARWHRTGFERVCSMVGGFFVLRFLNPALISPAEYGVKGSTGGSIQVSQDCRRNLTLIAKVQQNLSNSVRFSETKERFMTPLNGIFDRLGARFFRFVDTLTEVDDLDHHLSLDSYVRLAKLDREEHITVTANELYFMHDLLLRNKDALAERFGPKDELCALLSELPPAPKKLPRAQDYEVVLKLIPAKRAAANAGGAAAKAGASSSSREDEDDSGASELLRMSPEALFAEAEYHLFNIACAVTDPSAFDHEKDSSISAFLAKAAAAVEAAEDCDRRFKEHVTKIIDILDALKSEGVLSESNNFLPLRKALAFDIDNIPARVARAEGDYARLKEALEAIEKRQEDLLTQVEAYEEYLENVRSISVTVSSKSSLSGRASAPPATSSSSSSSTSAGTESAAAAAAAEVEGGEKATGAAAAAVTAESPVTAEVMVSLKEMVKEDVIVGGSGGVAAEGVTDMRFVVRQSGVIEITPMSGTGKRKEVVGSLVTEIVWDELLECQVEEKEVVTTELFGYNVNAMVFFINKHIFANRKR